MGRLILLLLIVFAIVLLWKAFGPASWNRQTGGDTPQIKGPDDDEEFLWELEKRHFKEMRARQEAERKAKLREKRSQEEQERNDKDGM